MKAGFIAIVGRPNVGKSTLLNRILGEKVAIVSPRAQTTRHRIKGILTRKDAQLVFVDTPGIHKPHHLLGQNLVKAAEEALGDSDVRLFLVDGSEKAGKGDEWVADLLKGKNPTLLVVNKSDRPGATTEEILASYRALGFGDA
ncbi:MAG: GTPase Era, partial [Bacteroidota bacterium]